MFSIRNVSMSVNGRTILRDIDLEIKAGERMVVLGINGSGKTSLLKILNGLVFPQKGQVLYKDHIMKQQDLNDGAFKKMFRKEVVLLFQNVDAMLFNPTVYDEISFGPRQFGFDDIEERTWKYAEIFGLKGFMKSAPFELSGGEKKMVALASIMSIEPDVLLLDEPTAHLDPGGAASLLEFINSLRGKTVVSTTQNLSIVEELGDRVVVLSKDHLIIFDGNPTELFSNEKLLIESGLVHKHIHRHPDTLHTHYHRHDFD